MLWFHTHSDGHRAVCAQGDGSLDINLFSCDGNSKKKNLVRIIGEEQRNHGHSSASMRKCVATSPELLVGGWKVPGFH